MIQLFLRPFAVVCVWLFADCQTVAQAPQERSDERATLAGSNRVLPSGESPADSRLGQLKGERGDFSFIPADSREESAARKERVRQIMRVALGLWPMPTKTPLNPVVDGRRNLGDYTVEKVYFQSVPGFFVAGNLYRPKGASGKRPAVLSPHGHFPGGRFIDEGRDAVRRKIVQGAERFEDGGRSFMQSRCVQLARMGCVVFHYDMIGYGDSQQIPLDVAHRFSRLRVKFDAPPPSGLYSAQALLQLQNPMGLHTYNSIRALDFLCSLPDVDTERIAVTGGSGGGTQTFMLCAVDDRPLVSVPAVIVSTERQGGCTCENICGLRIGTYNLEFTALHAPKPLMLISADDATRTMPQRGFPELQQHYRMLGAADNVAHVPILQFPHNYNAVSRAAMYHWLNKHLELGLDEPILERPYRRLTREELTVWNEAHPPPTAGPDAEQKLLHWHTEDARRQLAALSPTDAASLTDMRQVLGTGWNVLLRSLPSDASVAFEAKRKIAAEGHTRILGLLRYRTIEGHRAVLPVVRFVPTHSKGRTVIWLHEAGKVGLFSPDGELQPHIRELIDAGSTVVGVDLFQQGEFLRDGRPILRQRHLPGEEAFAGWTYCYNLPLFARRVHDVLAVVESIRTADAKQQIGIVGLKGVGPLAVAAVVQAGGTVKRAVVDTAGFRFLNVNDIYDVNFLPGAAKYEDVPALLALAAPTTLLVGGEDAEALPLARAAYLAAGKSENLILSRNRSLSPQAVVEWLTAD